MRELLNLLSPPPCPHTLSHTETSIHKSHTAQSQRDTDTDADTYPGKPPTCSHRGHILSRPQEVNMKRWASNSRAFFMPPYRKAISLGVERGGGNGRGQRKRRVKDQGRRGRGRRKKGERGGVQGPHRLDEYDTGGGGSTLTFSHPFDRLSRLRRCLRPLPQSSVVYRRLAPLVSRLFIFSSQGGSFLTWRDPCSSALPGRNTARPPPVTRCVRPIPA
jgi:hypothetical protein